MLAYDTKVIDRFWNRVSKSGDDDCWLWDNPVAGSGGYGRFTVNKVQHPAHVYAWMFEHGAVPAGHYICHRCKPAAPPTPPQEDDDTEPCESCENCEKPIVGRVVRALDDVPLCETCADGLSQEPTR